MRKQLRGAVVFVALVVILSTVLSATTVERLTLEDLAKKSQTIVQGTVRGSRTFWSPNGKLILTTTTIEVTEALKGQSSRTVDVTTIGGQIGDITLHVSGMPAFTAGETAIVFVEKSGDYQTVLGLGQGKFTVANGEVANSVSDLNFADGKPPRGYRMPLQTFKNEILSMVDRQR